MNQWKEELIREERLAKDLIKPLIEALNNDGEKWIKCWNTTSRVQRNIFTNQNYNGFNVCLLRLRQSLNDYDVGLWLTESQGNSLGWKIKFNAVGCIICCPYKCSENYFITDPISGEYHKDRLGNFVRRGHSPETFKSAQVFNISEFIETPNPKKKIRDTIHHLGKTLQLESLASERISNAKQICELWSLKETETWFGSSSAYYNTSDDKIAMPLARDFINVDEFYSTWLHEIIHSTGHPFRLGRMSFWNWKKDEYAREELVAEVGTFIFCQKLGLQTKLSQHAAYLSSWLKYLRKSPRIIFKILKETNEAIWMIRRNAGLLIKRNDYEKPLPSYSEKRQIKYN